MRKIIMNYRDMSNEDLLQANMEISNEIEARSDFKRETITETQSRMEKERIEEEENERLLKEEIEKLAPVFKEHFDEMRIPINRTITISIKGSIINEIAIARRKYATDNNDMPFVLEVLDSDTKEIMLNISSNVEDRLTQQIAYDIEDTIIDAIVENKFEDEERVVLDKFNSILDGKIRKLSERFGVTRIDIVNEAYEMAEYI